MGTGIVIARSSPTEGLIAPTAMRRISSSRRAQSLIGSAGALSEALAAASAVFVTAFVIGTRLRLDDGLRRAANRKTPSHSADPHVRQQQRDILKAAVAKDGTTVRLGPDVDLDFSDLPADFFSNQLWSLRDADECQRIHGYRITNC